MHEIVLSCTLSKMIPSIRVFHPALKGLFFKVCLLHSSSLHLTPAQGQTCQ